MAHYSPMSKEFQEEAKRLGLTGYQLRQKYETEGKSIKKEEVYVRNTVPRIICYSTTNTCPRIRKDGTVCGSKLIPHENARGEKDKEGKKTGRWICDKCYSNDRYKYGLRTVANCRTGNQNQSNSAAKGDKFQKLACILYEWKDLNKENDNHISPLDCYDPKTGLYHQVKGRYYDYIERLWLFSDFEGEWEKKYEDMVCFCISDDGNMVERIYKFPGNIVNNRSSVGVYKYDSKGRSYNNGWYEEYRITDEDELRKANEIWKDIIKEKCE